MEWVSIAAIVSMLVIVVVSGRPVETSLGAYALLLPFGSVLIAGNAGGIHLHATWFAGLAAVCVLLAIGLLKRGFLRPPRAALWLSMFVFWAGISSLWATDSKSSTLRLPVMGLLLALYLVAICLPVTGKELASIAWLSMLGACVAAGISLYQFHEGRYYLPEGKAYDDVLSEASGRASLWLGGIATSPNTLSSSLILPLSLALRLLLSARVWLLRLALTAFTVLIGSCIYITGSRGALVASAVVLLVYLLRSRRRLPLLMLIAIMAAAVAAVPGHFSSRLSGTLDDQGAGRFEIWQAGVETFKHDKVLGVGLGGFPAASSKYDYMYSAEHFHGDERAPHNIYLGTGVELGIVGLALLIISIASHLHSAARASSSSDESSRLQLVSYEAACWGLLVAGFFADLLWEEYFWLTWTLLIMSLRSRKAIRYVYCVPAEPLRPRLGVALPQHT